MKGARRSKREEKRADLQAEGENGGKWTGLVLVQIASRCATFATNQALLRITSPASFGQHAQLELLLQSVLFLSREGCRLTAARRSTDLPTVVALACVATGVGLGATFACACVLPFPTRLIMALFALAAAAELLAEPLIACTAARMQLRVRARCESTALLAKCVVTFAAAWAWHGGVMAFAVGDAAFGMTLLVLYLMAAPSMVWPRRVSSQDAWLATTITLQSLFKYVLTQGDKLLVGLLASDAEQGMYAVASNYGSLLARLGFQPIEESARLMYGRLSPAEVRESMTSILHLYIILGLFATALGPSIAPIALHMVAGDRWRSASDVLSAFAYYIPVLAVNGITEAYIQSTAPAADLQRQSAFMVVCSAGFGAAGYVFMKTFQMGAVGLVWANMFNLGMRSVWSIRLIHRNLGALHPWPRRGTLTAAAVSAAMARMNSSTLFLALNTVCMVLVCLALERKFLFAFLQSLRV